MGVIPIGGDGAVRNRICASGQAFLVIAAAQRRGKPKQPCTFAAFRVASSASLSRHDGTIEDCRQPSDSRPL
jgi:hypothetical protein